MLVIGFVNSMVSVVFEYKSEGLVFGVVINMFKLVGNVIVFGVVVVYIVGMIWFVFEKLML